MLRQVQRKNSRKRHDISASVMTTDENVAEKAGQFFKDHFGAVLCGADTNFPTKHWCRILRQAEHQLNLLRKSRVDPSKSSFEVMNGKHDYNANPFAFPRLCSGNACRT